MIDLPELPVFHLPEDMKKSDHPMLLCPTGLQREIAKLLNVSRGATVSKQIIRSRKFIAENSELCSQIARCEKRLNELRVTEQLLNA